MNRKQRATPESSPLMKGGDRGGLARNLASNHPLPPSFIRRGNVEIRVAFALFALLSSLFLSFGCRQDMHNQPKYKSLAYSDFFGDSRSARPLIDDTVARGHLNDDEHLYTGKVNGQMVDTFPFPITKEVLDRGQQRFNIYCTPCHDRTGKGEGMVVRRGFKPPPTFHQDRLRQASVGYLFDVVTNGFGAMAGYADQVPAKDRWAIIAYLRALQLSQNARIEDVPEQERNKLQ